MRIIEEEKPDAVLIAGDVYDRADPSATAVRIFDDFLSMLAEQKQEAFIIYGNHDSASRIAYGANIFRRSGIQVSPVYDEGVKPVRLEDESGQVDIYMLPYLRSVEAIEAIEKIEPDEAVRNVIVSHQFVTSAVIGESEEMNVGSLDNIDGSYYSKFDYAALGHIHMPQTIKPEKESKCVIRYSGSPLAYSFSDSDCRPKTATVVELKEKGDVTWREVSLNPLHRMSTIKAPFDDLMSDKALIDAHKDDYIKIILTNDKPVMDAMSRLQTVYNSVMTLEYEYMRSQSEDVTIEEQNAEGTPSELFDALYSEQHDGKAPDTYQQKIIDDLIQEIWEGGNETD